MASVKTAGARKTPVTSPVLPSASLVPFLFAVADLEAFPGTALSGLLSDLGMSESAARTLIARMRRRGELHSNRAGRRTTYRLAGAPLEELRRSAGASVPWQGFFHAVIFRVPEHCRGYRDQLRAQLQRLGFGVLRPGLLISPRDQWTAVEEQIADAPSSAQVLPAKLAMDLGDAREAAELAWDLNGRGAQYADLERRMRVHAEAALPEESGATLRQYYRLHQEADGLTRADDGLPAELLPHGWPASAMLAACQELSRLWHPVVQRYIAAVLHRTGTDDIAVRAARRRVSR